MSDTNSQDKTLLTTLKEVAFFAAVYLYFVGWVYISSFYETFGISLRSIDTPVYFFFIYSYNVLSRQFARPFGSMVKWISLGLVVVVVIAVLSILIIRRWKIRKGVIVGAILISLFPILYYVAQDAARADALDVRTQKTAMEITFVFKKDISAKYSIKLLKELKSKGEDKPEPSTGMPSQVPPRKRSIKSSDKKVEPNEDDSPTADSAELMALQRFLEANDRNSWDAKTEGSITAYWPKMFLITENSTTFYVLLQPQLESELLPYGYVYEVSKADVLVNETKIYK